MKLKFKKSIFIKKIKIIKSENGTFAIASTI